jgi:hypothetical protein
MVVLGNSLNKKVIYHYLTKKKYMFQWVLKSDVNMLLTNVHRLWWTANKSD